MGWNRAARLTLRKRRRQCERPGQAQTNVEKIIMLIVL